MKKHVLESGHFWFPLPKAFHPFILEALSLSYKELITLYAISGLQGLHLTPKLRAAGSLEVVSPPVVARVMMEYRTHMNTRMKHLKLMGYLEQDKDKRYKLTSSWIKIYKHLEDPTKLLHQYVINTGVLLPEAIKEVRKEYVPKRVIHKEMYQ